MPLIRLDEPLEPVLRRARRERLWQPEATTRPVDVRGEELRRLLPHRPPFLLLDAITAIDLDRRVIEGRRRVDPDDPVFAGHFPGHPVYPGILLVEAVAQLAACFHPYESGEAPGRMFATACRGIFLAPVHPGDDLVLLGACIGDHDGLYSRGVGQVLRGSTVCAVVVAEGCHLEDES